MLSARDIRAAIWDCDRWNPCTSGVWMFITTVTGWLPPAARTPSLPSGPGSAA